MTVSLVGVLLLALVFLDGALAGYAFARHSRWSFYCVLWFVVFTASVLRGAL